MLGNSRSHGTRRYIDGSKYTGELDDDNIPDGYGEKLYSNGSRYDGQWKGGFPHGEGKMSHGSGAGDVQSYEGGFLRGTVYGEGRMIYRDGGYYEGEFKTKTSPNDFEHGSVYPKADGHRHGFGKRVWSSGNCFEGTFANGKMEEGNYHNGANSKYVGTFKNNKKHGHGRETWTQENDSLGSELPFPAWLDSGKSKHFVYDGEYANGLFSGVGSFTSSDGLLYEGDWLEGRPHGHGRAILLPDDMKGDARRMNIGKHGSLYRPYKYDGQWVRGLRSGPGTMTYLDGTEIEGRFESGHPDGEVIYRYPSKKTCLRTYKNGVLQKATGSF